MFYRSLRLIRPDGFDIGTLDLGITKILHNSTKYSKSQEIDPPGLSVLASFVHCNAKGRETLPKVLVGTMSHPRGHVPSIATSRRRNLSLFRSCAST